MIAKKCKRSVLLPSAIGDWTKYRPIIEDAAKTKPNTKTTGRFPEKELLEMTILFLGIFEEYSRMLQKASSLSMTPASCSIETGNYAEILKSVDIPVVQFKISSPNMEPAFLCFDMPLSNALINASVGGQIDSNSAKNLTEIEENILEICASSGKEKIMGKLSINAEIKYLNSPNLYFDQSIDESATLFLAKSQLNFGKNTGHMFLVCSFLVAQDMLSMSRNKRSAVPDIGKIPVSITERVSMPVVSCLGNTTISAKELYELEPGDVIALDSSINNLLQISIGNDLNILGQPGIKDDRLCVQILKNGSSRVEKVKLSAPQLSAGPEKDSRNIISDERSGVEIQEESEFPEEEV